MVHLLRDEFNNMICNTQILGIDSLGNSIGPVSEGWVQEVEQLYSILDDERRGAIDGDRIQFFLMALLLNEIKDNNKDDMIVLIQK